MATTATMQQGAAAQPQPLSGYTIPGSRVFPEGLVYDEQTNALFTTSMEQGSIYRTTLDQAEFEVLSPAGANGCTSVLGLRIDPENRRLFASAGVTGMAYVFDADTGKPLGRYTNAIAPKERGTMGPNSTSPTLINDVVVIEGDAYFTDSYHPVLYKLPKSTIDATPSDGEARLEPWLEFEGTVLKYTRGDGLASGLNLNGIVATPDGRYLIVVATNTGKLFRIDVKTREVVEIVGQGNKGGDGMLLWGDGKLLVIDMTQPKPLTKLQLSNDYAGYDLIDRYSVPGNISPTNCQIIGDRILITESQIVDVLFGKESEHPPYRVTVHPVSIIGEGR
jgi:Cu-Zn family superoxide dismutase